MKDTDIEMLDRVRVILRKYNKAVVSRETGISAVTLHHICNNPDHRPTPSKIHHLALYLGLIDANKER